MRILDLMNTGVDVQMLPNEVDDTVTMRFTKDGVVCNRVFDRSDIIILDGNILLQAALCEGVMNELNMSRK